MSKMALGMVGKKFGDLFVEGVIKDNGRIKCKCICTACGTIKLLRVGHLNAGQKTCGCGRGKKKQTNSNWKGCGRISGYMWGLIKETYKKSKKAKSFNITLDYIWKLYEEQGGRCAISGLPIDFAVTNEKHKAGESSASLDRIDSNGGYVVGNVQWLHKEINRMKLDFPQSRFIDLCRIVTEKQNETSVHIKHSRKSRDNT